MECIKENIYHNVRILKLRKPKTIILWSSTNANRTCPAPERYIWKKKSDFKSEKIFPSLPCLLRRSAAGSLSLARWRSGIQPNFLHSLHQRAFCRNKESSHVNKGILRILWEAAWELVISDVSLSVMNFSKLGTILPTFFPVAVDFSLPKKLRLHGARPQDISYRDLTGDFHLPFCRNGVFLKKSSPAGLMNSSAFYFLCVAGIRGCETRMCQKILTIFVMGGFLTF